MADSILKADNDPVQILHPLHHGNTTISWQIDGIGLGGVWVSVNGAPEVKFSPPQAGELANQGSQQAGINLGDTLTFTLYLGDQASKLLGGLTVTAEQTFGNQGGATLHEVLCDLGLIQCIQNLRVFPSADFVDFSFQTSQPTVPIIAVSTDAPRPGPSFSHTDAVGAAGDGLQHFARITGLSQDTTYYYIIWAGRSTSATGSFRTGSRFLRVTFDRIHVIRDGDPGGTGELVFTFAAYDARDGSMLGRGPDYPDDGAADIGDGQDVTVDRKIEIVNAPPALTLYVYCRDWDDDLIPYPGEGLPVEGYGPPLYAPTGPDQGEDDWGEWATAVQTFEPGTFLPFSVEMDSANGGVAFKVFGRIEGQITMGAWKTLKYRRSSPPPMTAVAGGLGEAANIVSGGGRVATVAPGLDGAVYCKVFTRTSLQASPSSWLDLGGNVPGPITAVFTEEDRVDIFGIGPDGGLMHNHIKVEERGLEAGGWRDLGGNLTGPVTAVVIESGRLDVFGLNCEGAVQHRTLRGSYSGQGHDSWRDLGGKFHSPITALAIGSRDLEVFAIGRDRGVYYKTLHHHEAQQSGHHWEDLGGDFCPLRLIAVPLKGDRLELFAFVDQETTYRKLRVEGRWFPSERDWERLFPGRPNRAMAKVGDHKRENWKSLAV